MAEDKKSSRSSLWVLSIAACCIFIWSVFLLLKGIHTIEIPFDTDEADHANAGIELFRAFQSHSLMAIIQAVRRQAFYPPIFSFFVAVSYAVSGVSLFASRLPSVVFYLLSGALLSGAVWRSLSDKTPAIRALSATLPLLLLASSPLMIESGTLCMLELSAVAFVSALLFGLTYFIDEQKRGIFLLIALLSIFFVKYNFGILVIPGVIASFVLIPPWKISTSKRDWIKSIVLGFLIAASFVAWLFLSYRESVIHFFVGHPSYSPLLSAENLLFEVKSWFKEYSSNYLVAIWTLVLAISGAVKNCSSPASRAAYFITAASFAVLLLSTTNEARHFIVAAPCIWYLASLGFGEVASRCDSRIHLAVTPLLVLSLYWGCYKVIPETRKIIVKGMEGDEHFSKLEQGLISSLDPSSPVLFLGVTDQFGIEALRWQAARASGLPYTKVRLDAFPFRDDKNYTAKMRMRNVAAPYEIQGFLKEPLSEVLKQQYYTSLVTIRAIGDRGELSSLIKSVKESYEGKKVFQETQGGLEVSVFNLSSQ